MNTKVCKKCKIDQNISEYYTHKNYGFQAMCKKCYALYRKENRDYLLKQRRKRYQTKYKEQYREYRKKNKNKIRQSKQENKEKYNQRTKIRNKERYYSDVFMLKGIHKFILITDNVLNSFSDDDSYYEEWYEDVSDHDGWLVFLQMRPHVLEEFKRIRLSYFAHYGEDFDNIPWRKLAPVHLLEAVERCIGKYLKD